MVFIVQLIVVFQNPTNNNRIVVASFLYSATAKILLVKVVVLAQLTLSFDSVTHVESRSDRGPCYFAKNVSTKTFLLSKNARRQLSFLSHSCFDADVLGFAYRIMSIV